jgi:hypothetical protein
MCELEDAGGQPEGKLLIFCIESEADLNFCRIVLVEGEKKKDCMRDVTMR